MIPCAKSQVAARIQNESCKGFVCMNLGLDCNGGTRTINSVSQVHFVSFTLGSFPFNLTSRSSIMS